MTKTINIRESVYNALKVHNRYAESFSDVIFRLAGSEETNICDYLRTLDPVIQDIGRTFSDVKRDLLRIKPKIVTE